MSDTIGPTALQIIADFLPAATFPSVVVDELHRRGYVIIEKERLDYLERIEDAASDMPIDIDDWIDSA